MPRHLIATADARRIPLPDESVQMVCTSPPYWGLRDYGTAAWDGGDAGCDHREGYGRRDKGRLSNDPRPGVNPAPVETPTYYRDLCGKCGARRVDRQIGLEATPEAYCAEMVAVFREVWRVLRPDGVVFLNIGDSMASSGGHTKQGETSQRKGRSNVDVQLERKGYSPPRESGEMELRDDLTPSEIAYVLHELSCGMTGK